MVKQLRAEIIVDRAHLPGTQASAGPPGGASVRQCGDTADPADVRGGSQGGLGAHETLLH
jgi:hypothetical protein